MGDVAAIWMTAPDDRDRFHSLEALEDFVDKYLRGSDGELVEIPPPLTHAPDLIRR